VNADPRATAAPQAACEVSVVVVNWNARDYLRRCLASIIEQTQLPVEIIVVDNASRDGSADMVRAEFPAVRLIVNDENRGFAAANNQGLRIARGRWLLLLNPDTVVLNGAIDKTVAYALGCPAAGVVGCRVMESETRVQRTCFGFPGPLNLLLVETGLCRMFPASRLFGRPWIGWWDRDCERDVDVVSGMFMLVRREAMEQVGLMDEDYFVYAEEADWCFRFARAGWRCVFAPVASILHCEGGGQSTRQVKPRMHVQLQKSVLIFNRKNLGIAAWLLVKAVFLVGSMARVMLFTVSGLVSSAGASAPRVRLATASLRYHLLGSDPCS
jgi:GT2 family glycosyltransferase